MKTLIVPLVASAVAVTLLTAPVFAGSHQDRQDRLGASQTFKQDFKSRKAERRAHRKAARQGKFKQARGNRKARRNGGAGAMTSAGAYGNSGPIAGMLNGHTLPEYIGGYNQSPNNGAGSITQSLGGYDLPDYIGGHNQAPNNGSGSILEAIGGGVDFSK